MADGFAERVRPLVDPMLEPGEQLLGIVAATLKKTFSGGLYAIGVTDRRLILQAFDRKFQPKEPALLLPREALSSAGVEGDSLLGGPPGTSDIVDALSATVVLKTADGQKFKLMMMQGGDGLMGGLGGGESQAQGVRALGEWLNRNFPQG